MHFNGPRSLGFLPLALLILSFDAAGAVDIAYHAPPAVSDESEAQRLIKDLESDDFQVREKAQDELIARGESAEAPVLARLAQAPGKGESADLRERLQRVVSAIELAPIANLDGAVDAAPSQYIPPDPAVREKLKSARVTFSFVDLKLEEALELMQRETHVLIWAPPGTLDQPVNLRVSDMPAELALSWIGRLCNLEMVVRGRVLILTEPFKAQRLHLQRKSFQLRGSWSEYQTFLIARMLVRASLDPLDIGPGRFTLECGDTVIGNVERALEGLAATGDKPLFIDEAQSRFDGWSRPISIAKGERFDDVLQHAGFPCVIDQNIGMVFPSLAPAAGISGFEFIERLCAELNAAPDYSAGASDASVLLSLSDPHTYSVNGCILDLRPALKSGVSEKQLIAGLEQALKDAQHYANRAEIHGDANGFVFATLDIWTARRAQQFIQACAAARKCGALPPLPLFLRSRVNVVKRVPSDANGSCIRPPGGLGMKREPFAREHPKSGAAPTP